MPEELYPGLYLIKIPLPGSPLKNLNAYLIKGDARSLLVDTGLNRDECRDAMHRGLADIGVPLESLDIFITHLHADHFGLVSTIATNSTMIFFNRPDGEIIENWQGFDPMVAYAGKNGFPEDDLRAALNQHPGYKYGTNWMPALRMIDDNEKLTYGVYELTCIQTPGHTPGHTCLYNEKNRFLIAGDHILEDITPNIQCWSDDHDPLKDYLKSLDKIRNLPVDRVLPGHRRVFTNYTERIDTLRNHHLRRLKEIEAILGQGVPMSAYEVASRMKWDITAENWESFPVAQKWFATGEAVSHLRLLENDGRIDKDGNGRVVTYTKGG
jgi:glyoxylase-like metal-dependent hydrolase (beta-lactamase superfamily II)